MFTSILGVDLGVLESFWLGEEPGLFQLGSLLPRHPLFHLLLLLELGPHLLLSLLLGTEATLFSPCLDSGDGIICLSSFEASSCRLRRWAWRELGIALLPRA